VSVFGAVCLCRLCRSRASAFNDLVEFATVKPNPPTFRAVINLDAATLSNHEHLSVHGTLHAGHLSCQFQFISAFELSTLWPFPTPQPRKRAAVGASATHNPGSARVADTSDGLPSRSSRIVSLSPGA